MQGPGRPDIGRQMQGPGRPDIANAGSGETGYSECRAGSGGRPDIANAGSGEPVQLCKTKLGFTCILAGMW
ncbi:unnamed protein product, partial [Staurois parvus]